MNALDAVIALLVVVAAFSGHRRGFLVGVISFLGFLAGLIIGVLLAGRLAPHLPLENRLLVEFAVTVACAGLSQLLFGVSSQHLRRHLTNRTAQRADRAGGVFVGVTGVLMICWLLASTIRQAPYPEISSMVRGSVALTTIDSAVPERTRSAIGSFQSLLVGNGFPPIFSGLEAEHIVPVDPPNPAVVDARAIRAAAGSMVKVSGDAVCDRSMEGSGFFFAPHLVATNAHVVAGVTRVMLRLGGVGDYWAATVVAFDPSLDLAVLRTDLVAPALALDPAARRGDDAIVAGFPLDGPYQLEAARVRGRTTIHGPDIYSASQVSREVLSLYASVEPGNSGGPLLGSDGRVIGVVFAKSIDDPSTAYALSLSAVKPLLDRSRAWNVPVDTGPCAG